MDKNFFTVSDLAGLLGGNERMARKLLNDAGADPRLDEYINQPGETITRELLVDLLAMRAGDYVGRKVAELLRGE
jgi:hypothetical protein